MNTFKKLLTCVLMGGLLWTATACNDDDDDPSDCNYLADVQDEIDALEAATDAYIADSTNPAKCQAWKDAYQDYLNALEDNIECATTAGQEDELQQAIDEAEAALANIQC